MTTSTAPAPTWHALSFAHSGPACCTRCRRVFFGAHGHICLDPPAGAYWFAYTPMPGGEACPVRPLTDEEFKAYRETAHRPGLVSVLPVNRDANVFHTSREPWGEILLVWKREVVPPRSEHPGTDFLPI